MPCAGGSKAAGRCLPGARDAQELQIRLKFALNPDGMLSAYPVVLNASGHPAFDAAARSAQSAVKMCEPYNFLPVEKYDLWRDIILTFDPSRFSLSTEDKKC
jgi:hypothetical protein